MCLGRPWCRWKSMSGKVAIFKEKLTDCISTSRQAGCTNLWAVLRKLVLCLLIQKTWIEDRIWNFPWAPAMRQKNLLHRVRISQLTADPLCAVRSSHKSIVCHFGYFMTCQVFHSREDGNITGTRAGAKWVQPPHQSLFYAVCYALWACAPRALAPQQRVSWTTFRKNGFARFSGSVLY